MPGGGGSRKAPAGAGWLAITFLSRRSTLVFAEVKARHGSDFGSAAEAVDRRKRDRMTKAAEAFLTQRELGECDCRFDVVEVVIHTDGLSRVNLIRNAFMAGE